MQDDFFTKEGILSHDPADYTAFRKTLLQLLSEEAD